MTTTAGASRTELLYACEDRSAQLASLRRFATFASLESYVQRTVLSGWWSAEFPDAPLDVEVTRRSRNATCSLAATDTDGVGLIAIVDGTGWGLETVLHELAHLASGPASAHDSRFTTTLMALWRHEAGVEAWAALGAELDRHGLI
ncbi:MAG: hypothetical protein ACR2OH_07770 [Microthrixaceae bacterium]